MKAVVLTGLREMALTERPDPEPGPGEVRLRVEAVGVCGSDVHYYTTGRIGSHVVEYPFMVGHECAGTVDRLGEGVRDLQVGQRVAVDPAMPCHACDQCEAGREHTCRNLRFLGCPDQAEGCLAEYLVMPAESCFAVPEQMTAERAALSEPLTIGVYAVQQSVPMAGTKVGILGSGPIGLSVLAPALHGGAAAVYMTDRIDARCAVAREAGAHWAGNPDTQDVVADVLRQEPQALDVVFECAGQQESFDQAFELLKPGGKLMLIGIPEFDRYSFQADIARRREICIQHVRRQNNCARKTLDLVATGALNVDAMVTHRFPLEETQKAFDLVADYKDGVVKAMIRLDR